MSEYFYYVTRPDHSERVLTLWYPVDEEFDPVFPPRSPISAREAVDVSPAVVLDTQGLLPGDFRPNAAAAASVVGEVLTEIEDVVTRHFYGEPHGLHTGAVLVDGHRVTRARDQEGFWLPITAEGEALPWSEIPTPEVLWNGVP